jgi:FKBP-type peptidyl-prolyl cis-trans isomerase FkpA
MNTKKWVAAFMLVMGGFYQMACSGSKNGFKVAENGAEYKILKDEKGNNAVLGDMLSLHLILYNSKDSILRNSYTEGSPLNYKVSPSPFKGGVDDAMTLLSVGDSAMFLVPVDSLFKDAPGGLPPGVEKGSKLKFLVKILTLKTEAEQKAEMEKAMKDQAAAAEKQVEIDEQTIKDWLAKSNVKATRSESGIYYEQQKAGSGNVPNVGDTVYVHYTGMLLDGSPFDSSVRRGQPISFPIGTGYVIRGWDETLLKMKKGEKGRVLIPSGLAYGQGGNGSSIPPNAVLLFELEMVDIRK